MLTGADMVDNAFTMQTEFIGVMNWMMYDCYEMDDV